jgi:hypothetical protein
MRREWWVLLGGALGISDLQVAWCACGYQVLRVVTGHRLAVDVVDAVCQGPASFQLELAPVLIAFEDLLTQGTPGPGGTVLPAFAHARTTLVVLLHAMARAITQPMTVKPSRALSTITEPELRR